MKYLCYTVGALAIWVGIEMPGWEWAMVSVAGGVLILYTADLTKTLRK